MSRHDARTWLDAQLARPLDPEKAAEHDRGVAAAALQHAGELEERKRANWGLSSEAIAAAAAKDAMFAGVSYEDPTP